MLFRPSREQDRWPEQSPAALISTSMRSHLLRLTHMATRPGLSVARGRGTTTRISLSFKDFKSLERVTFQARVEALNAFNTAELGTPNTTITGVGQGTNASTGAITSSLGFGRIVQIGGKLIF